MADPSSSRTSRPSARAAPRIGVAADRVQIAWSISVPSEVAPLVEHLQSSAHHAVPISLPTQQERGRPLSSRESQCDHLEAIADGIDQLKTAIMADLSAWKDILGKHEDMHAKRGNSGRAGVEKSGSGRAPGTDRPGDAGQEEEDDEDEDEEEEEEEV
ncbi:unnamed protein product [Parajaminaea phylloscopi]